MRIVQPLTVNTANLGSGQSDAMIIDCQSGSRVDIGHSPEDTKSNSAKCDVNDIRIKDVRAPRYTSYPTADRFIEAFEPKDYVRHLGARSLSGGQNLSLYMHIPFCESLCYYCACNKTVTRNKGKSQPYVSRLIDEMTLVDQYLGGDRRLTQLHWGGGTPTFLSSQEIEMLMENLRQHFDFSERSEISIEIDPRAVDDQKLEVLAAQGFNRISLGVQDFDVDVQCAINRIQPEAMTGNLLGLARSLGFRSTNFDLIYGLPLQSVESFSKTIESVIKMRPERVALYNYAHMPTRFSAQRMINDDDMPDAVEKMAIFDMSCELLENAGYVYIGMDHFALPDDELTVALRSGRLHRNFQGYSTQSDTDLIAFGSSSISQVGTSFSQNTRGVNDYMDRIGQGILATQRGVELNQDDLLRRYLIMALMCQGQVWKESVEVAHLIDFDQYFTREMKLIKPYVDQGFVELSDDAITVTESGRRKALRLIAGVFDRYLQQRLERDAYSCVL